MKRARKVLREARWEMRGGYLWAQVPLCYDCAEKATKVRLTPQPQSLGDSLRLQPKAVRCKGYLCALPHRHICQICRSNRTYMASEYLYITS